MAFLTPCFVRVEDREERKKLIELLKRIGWRFRGIASPEKKYVVADAHHQTVTTWVLDEWGAERFENIGYIFCGTNVELFKALAAMNDENCLYQWFTDGHNWGLCEDEYWAVQVAEWDVREDDDMLNMAVSTGCHKATAEEIVEYFKKREKCKR